MFDNMVMWLSSPEQAALVNAALWASAIVSVVFMAIKTVVDHLRWRKLGKQAAHSLARLAVFNSWVGAGGWSDGESAYEDRMTEYREKAENYGKQFVAEFNAHALSAEMELDSVLYSFQQQVLKDERDAVIRAEADSARHQHNTEAAAVRSYTCHRESGAERLVRTPLRRGCQGHKG